MRGLAENRYDLVSYRELAYTLPETKGKGWHAKKETSHSRVSRQIKPAKETLQIELENSRHGRALSRTQSMNYGLIRSA
jgi:hypothetical protein